MILPLKKQVCSLKLAKKLKELGVEQGSFWWWVKVKRFSDKYELEYNPKALSELRCSAYTVAELSILLPCKVTSSKVPKNKLYYYRIEVQKGVWVGIQNRIEVNAKAEMLILLIERGLMKL